MTMHAARLDKSERLQRLYKALAVAGRKGLTTWQLVRACRSSNPARDASELRYRGVGVRCDYEGMNKGRRVYRYTLEAL